jgi:hypothetical protein
MRSGPCANPRTGHFHRLSVRIVSPRRPPIFRTLFHKSACLSTDVPGLSTKSARSVTARQPRRNSRRTRPGCARRSQIDITNIRTAGIAGRNPSRARLRRGGFSVIDFGARGSGAASATEKQERNVHTSWIEFESLAALERPSPPAPLPTSGEGSTNEGRFAAAKRSFHCGQDDGKRGRRPLGSASGKIVRHPEPAEGRVEGPLAAATFLRSWPPLPRLEEGRSSFTRAGGSRRRARSRSSAGRPGRLRACGAGS